MKKAIYISIILLWIVSLHKANAQKMYQTQNGNMVITVVSADTILKITAKKLLIVLNYENANIIIKMNRSDFFTGNDSLDKKLASMKFETIDFNGKLNIDYINTTGHPPLDFEVSGVLSTNNHIITGTGHLEHISSGGTFSCLLTLRFYLKKDDLGLNLEGLNLKDDIQIEIVQAVLKAKN